MLRWLCYVGCLQWSTGSQAFFTALIGTALRRLANGCYEQQWLYYLFLQAVPKDFSRPRKQGGHPSNAASKLGTSIHHGTVTVHRHPNRMPSKLYYSSVSFIRILQQTLSSMLVNMLAPTTSVISTLQFGVTLL